MVFERRRCFLHERSADVILCRRAERMRFRPFWEVGFSIWLGGRERYDIGSGKSDEDVRRENAF